MSAGGVAKLKDAVRADVDASVLCWLATVDADGAPNVSPK
jgi:predicted pyridoxine 5'-phosphate oxidase superfamily flavin-nucleotide-binding protein